jgi:feruloyl esterase
MRRWRVVPLAAALLGTLAACGGGGGGETLPQLSAAVGAPLSGTCDDLAVRLATVSDISVTSVTTEAAGAKTVAGQPVREHCLVKASTETRVSPADGQTYAIKFEMRLPKDWNGRFLHQGNGGTDGSVNEAVGSFAGGPLTHALHQGFAVLSSDAGHDNTAGQGTSFGIDPQARLNYGYQAVAKLTPIARNIIAAAYTKGPDRSYFAGCSNGGRHAMVAATRYARDYDGILAGAPGYNLPKAAVANIAGGQLYHGVATAPGATPNDLRTGFTDPERTMVANAVLARCDSLDGATDGLVQDVAACQAAFDLQRDVPTCSGARDGTCLSAAQKSAIGKIFSGPTTSDGKLIYAAFPYDSGLGASGIATWEFTAPLDRDSGAVGVIFKVPPESPSFDGRSWSLSASIDTLVQQITATSSLYTESAMSFMTPPNPTDMSILRERGGKIMVYHGVSDPIFSVNDTETWFTGLQARFGRAAETFARFYRVPGMGHCSGGPATDQFDALSALVSWVEQGNAPGALMASARGAGNAGGVNAEVPAGWSPTRTRPLCPYPKVARYNGSGDVESASSFSCQ